MQSPFSYLSILNSYKKKIFFLAEVLTSIPFVLPCQPTGHLTRTPPSTYSPWILDILDRDHSHTAAADIRSGVASHHTAAVSDPSQAVAPALPLHTDYARNLDHNFVRGCCRDYLCLARRQEEEVEAYRCQNQQHREEEAATTVVAPDTSLVPGTHCPLTDRSHRDPADLDVGVDPRDHS